MLANFLSKSKPINFIVLLSFFFCFYLSNAYNVFFIDGFLINDLVEALVLFVLFITIFFFFNFIVVKNRLTFDNFYAFFIFTLGIIFISSSLLTYKNLILLLLHLLFLRKIYALKSIKEVLKKLFDAGFWLGTSFLIEPFLGLFAVLIYVGVFLHQKITFHTLFSPVIGFLTPLFIYFTYYYWSDKTEKITQLFNFDVATNFSLNTASTSIWFLAIVFLFTLISLLLKSPKAFSVNNSFKKNWILLIVNLLVTLFFTLIIQEKNGSEIMYLLFPAAIIIANGLEIIQNKLIKNSLFILMIIGVVLHQFFL